jgi:hypothetical protein
VAEEQGSKQPALLPQHARLIEASAINAGLARGRGYFSAASPATLRQFGFTRAQARTPALVIPLWNVHGTVAFHQARPDQPRLRDGKPIKYETPNGARMVLDVHPATRRRLGDAAFQTGSAWRSRSRSLLSLAR